MKRAIVLAGLLTASLTAPAMADPLAELTKSAMQPVLTKVSVQSDLDGAVRYTLGDRLPNQSERIRDYRPYRLSPPPIGAYYARINSDLVLVSEDTHKIMNLVGLVFSAS